VWRRACGKIVVIQRRRCGQAERAGALEEGADDYLNKPFEPYELVARIRAVPRRSRPGVPSLAGAHRLRCGQLELDRTLSDDAEPPRCIETLIGQGYRFIGQVEAGG
jgi:DNA-binding response OmpR family regulator